MITEPTDHRIWDNKSKPLEDMEMNVTMYIDTGKALTLLNNYRKSIITYYLASSEAFRPHK